MGDEILPIGALLFLAQVVNRPAVNSRYALDLLLTIKVEEATEVALIAKSRASLFEQAEALIRTVHPYDRPYLGHGPHRSALLALRRVSRARFQQRA